MTWHYTQFDEVDLPLYNPEQDHSPVAAASPFLPSIGGAFDVFGDDDARAQLQTIRIAGVVWGEEEKLTDETGDWLTDETGDTLIAGDGPTMLRAQLVALREKVRKTGVLWRTRLDDGTREWKRARFVRMNQPQQVRDRLFKAHVTCEFETIMAHWHAETQSSVSDDVAAGGTATLVVENPGATIDDAVISITGLSGTITNLVVACPDLGIQWSWGNGLSLSAGETLVVDAGTQDAVEGATGAYAGLTIGGTSPGLLTIEPGTWAFLISATGGSAEVEISWYNQTP